MWLCQLRHHRLNYRASQTRPQYVKYKIKSEVGNGKVNKRQCDTC